MGVAFVRFGIVIYPNHGLPHIGCTMCVIPVQVNCTVCRCSSTSPVSIAKWSSRILKEITVFVCSYIYTIHCTNKYVRRVHTDNAGGARASDDDDVVAFAQCVSCVFFCLFGSLSSVLSLVLFDSLHIKKLYSN